MDQNTTQIQNRNHSNSTAKFRNCLSSNIMLAKSNKRSNIFEVDLDRDQEKVVNVQVKEFQQTVEPKSAFAPRTAEEEAVLSLSGHKAPLSSEGKGSPLDVSALTDGSLKPLECQESVPSNEIKISTSYDGQRQGGQLQHEEEASRTKDNQSLSNSFLSCSKTSQAEALKRIIYHHDKGNVGQPFGYKSKHQKKNSCQLMKKSNIIEYSVNQKYQSKFAGQFDKKEDFALEKEAKKQSRMATSSSANIYSSEKKNHLMGVQFGRNQSRGPQDCRSPSDIGQKFEN